MLKGKALGQAIKEALALKGMKQADLARKFHVEPPSISGWIRTGRIDKTKMWQLMELMSDVVGPEHWGLESKEPPRRTPLPGYAVLHPSDPKVSRPLTSAQRTFSQLVDSMLPTLNPSQIDTLTRLVVEFAGRNASEITPPEGEHKRIK